MAATAGLESGQFLRRGLAYVCHSHRPSRTHITMAVDLITILGELSFPEQVCAGVQGVCLPCLLLLLTTV